jgi:AcrR family transcriptional regulator
LDAAIRIVDAEGLEALTLRRLGLDVGVSYTAVYTYFKTREDLIAALVDRISEEIIAGIAPSGDSARDQLIAIAMSSRRALARHPRLATVYITGQSDAVVGNQATLSVVALLESSGIKGRDVVTAYRVLENYVFGSTIFDFGAAPNHLSIRRRRYRATSHPEFKAVGLSDKAVGQHNDEAFVLGLSSLLKGLGV